LLGLDKKLDHVLFWPFSNDLQVVDCRICGDPHSVLRFAFVEFADEREL